MRLIQGSIRARVKGFWPIVWTDEALSAHGGLELFSRFLWQRGWLEQLREVFSVRRFDTDYGSWRMSLAVIGLLLVGGSRLAHLRQLGRDPVFLRFARLRQLPSERTLSRWLGQMTCTLRDRLQVLLRDVAFATWAAARLSRVTLELDGTILRTGTCVEGAERGFNPHHPKDPSYYPLTAHLAQTGQMLGVWNRPGNSHDSVGAVDRLEALLDEVRERLGSVPTEVRLDSAFCQKAILELLTASRVEYAIKMPMWKWLEVQPRITRRKQWVRVNASVDAFSMSLRIEKWKRTERVVVFRKRISGKPAKAFQLELFQPDDGFYEYSMVATNKTCRASTLWSFMAGRGGHENTLGELKNGLAFGSVVTQDWDANSAWQILNALTHNLVRDFQLHAGIATAKATRASAQPGCSSARCARYASSGSISPRASRAPRDAPSCVSLPSPRPAGASTTHSATSPPEAAAPPENPGSNDGSGLASRRPGAPGPGRRVLASWHARPSAAAAAGWTAARSGPPSGRCPGRPECDDRADQARSTEGSEIRLGRDRARPCRRRANALGIRSERTRGRDPRRPEHGGPRIGSAARLRGLGPPRRSHRVRGTERPPRARIYLYEDGEVVTIAPAGTLDGSFRRPRIGNLGVAYRTSPEDGSSAELIFAAGEGDARAIAEGPADYAVGDSILAFASPGRGLFTWSPDTGTEQIAGPEHGLAVLHEIVDDVVHFSSLETGPYRVSTFIWDGTSIVRGLLGTEPGTLVAVDGEDYLFRRGGDVIVSIRGEESTILSVGDEVDSRIVEGIGFAHDPFVGGQVLLGSPSGTYPDYSIDTIFGALAGVIELAAASTGNDLMPAVLPDGTLVMNNQWYTLSVSVSNTSPGASGSHPARIVGGSNSPGAELYTLYFIDSVGLEEVLINTNHSERSRTQLGLQAPSLPPLQRPDVVGLDIAMGVIAFDPQMRSTELFPTRNRFYFTVTPDCVPALGPSFAIDPTLPPANNTVPADPATIYETSWTYAGGAGSWSQPVIFRSPNDLGLDPEVDQIDAITVSPDGDSVVFSTQLVTGRNQLLVQQGLTMTPQPLKASNGMEATQHLGLTEDDDVDGTCGIDPKGPGTPSGSVGVAQLAFDTAPLGLSVARYSAGEDAGERLLVQVTGLDGLSKSTVRLYRTESQMAESGSPLSKASNWQVLGQQVVAPGQSSVTWILPAPALGYEAAFVAYSLGSPWSGSQDSGGNVAGLIRSSWVSMLDLPW